MNEMYTCPMHPEVRQEGPGKCPKCGMALVKESELAEKTAHAGSTDDSNYGKLFTLIGVIALAAAAGDDDEFYGRCFFGVWRGEDVGFERVC